MISIVNLCSGNFHRYQGKIMEIERASFPFPWTLSAFKEEVGRTVSHIWLLILDDVCAGYICFWRVAGEIHLMNIAIHPESRGKGLGRILLAKMIQLGVSEGDDSAWLEVRPSNLKARLLYEELGFREMGRRPRYYRETNEDAIVMCLTLARKQEGACTKAGEETTGDRSEKEKSSGPLFR